MTRAFWTSYGRQRRSRSVLGQLGIDGVFEPSDESYVPPRSLRQDSGRRVEVGLVGEVHPEMLERFDLDPRPVALFELRLQSLLQCLSDTSRRVQSLARYPAATRDLALVVRRTLPPAK